MTCEQIVIMTTEGEILSCLDGLHPSSEWRLHAELYKMKSEVNAVVHTHSPYATAFASLREEIPLVLAEIGPENVTELNLVGIREVTVKPTTH